LIEDSVWGARLSEPLYDLSTALSVGARNGGFFPTTASDAAMDNGNAIARFERKLKNIHYNKTDQTDQNEQTLRRLSAAYDIPQRLLVYPFDLATAPENMDYILFDIYESQGAGISTVQEKVDAQDGTRSLLTLGGIGAATQLASGTVAKVGGGLAVAATNQFSTLYGAAGNLADSAARAATNPNLGKGEIGFTQEMSGFAQATDRVKTSIGLYMPSSVTTKYGISYQGKDFTEMSMLASIIKGSIDKVGEITGLGEGNEASAKAMDAAMQVVGQQSLKLVDKVVQGILGGENGAGLSDVVNAANRAVPNPMVLQLFQGVERRTFGFSFEFVPVSEKEALTVYNIIRTFKKYAHPRRAVQGRYLEFPAEFRLTFMQGTEENLYLPRIARCVLTGIDVSYGTDSVYSSFKKNAGRNGSPPIKTTMTLQFSEAEILTQERIDQGY
jgi:hypothetical protein